MEAGLQRALAAHGLGAAVAALERAGVMNWDSLSFVDDEVMQHLAQVERLPIVLCKMLRARLPAILQAAGPREGLGGVEVAETSARGAAVAEGGRVGAAAVSMGGARASSAVSGADAARVSAVDNLGASSTASGADAARVSVTDSLQASSMVSGADAARVSAADSLGASPLASGADAADSALSAAPMDNLRASPAASGADAANAAPSAAPTDAARLSPAAPNADAATSDDRLSPTAAPMDSTKISPAAPNADAATSDDRLSPTAAPMDSTKISPAAPNADATAPGGRPSPTGSARHSPAAVVTESDSSGDDAAPRARTISSVSTTTVLAKAPATTPTETNLGRQTLSPSTSPAFLAAGTAIDSARPTGSKSQFFEELEPGSTPRPLDLHSPVRADDAASRHATHKRGRGTSPSPTPKLPQLTRQTQGPPGMVATGSRRTFPFLLNFPALAPDADIIRVPALRPVAGSKKGKDAQVHFTRPMKKSLAQSRDAKGKFRSARKKSPAKGPPIQSGENTRHAHTYIHR